MCQTAKVRSELVKNKESSFAQVNSYPLPLCLTVPNSLIHTADTSVPAPAEKPPSTQLYPVDHFLRVFRDHELKLAYLDVQMASRGKKRVFVDSNVAPSFLFFLLINSLSVFDSFPPSPALFMLIKSSDTEQECRSQLPGRGRPDKGCHKCWSQNNWWISELKPRVLMKWLAPGKVAFFSSCSHVCLGFIVTVYLPRTRRHKYLVNGFGRAYRIPTSERFSERKWQLTLVAKENSSFSQWHFSLSSVRGLAVIPVTRRLVQSLLTFVCCVW